MAVPLLDLVRQYETIRDELDEAVLSVARTQKFILGETVERFEKQLADYCGVRFAIGVASGTDALIIALMTLGIGKGDEVITTPYSFFATASSIWRVGAKPVFVDIDPKTFNIDPNQVEKVITPRTKAIMPVHLFGQCADMTAIRDIAERRGLRIVEDAAQALSATFENKKAGTLGDVGCFSFFPSKNLGGYGDGGAIVTNDEGIAMRARRLRVHGADKTYYHLEVGLNSRLDALQAAVLAVKLPHLDSWSEGRRKNAKYYDREFELPVQTPVNDPRCYHIYNQYVIRTPKRNAVLQELRDRQIGCSVYYPVPLHLQPCFASLGYKEGSFPHAEQAARETLALPVFPELTREEQDEVIRTVMSCL